MPSIHQEFQKDTLKNTIASHRGYPPLLGFTHLQEEMLEEQDCIMSWGDLMMCAEMVCSTAFKAFARWNRRPRGKLVRSEWKNTVLYWCTCLSYPSLLLYSWMLSHHCICHRIWQNLVTSWIHFWSVAKNCRIETLSPPVSTGNLPICSNRQHSS